MSILYATACGLSSTHVIEEGMTMAVEAMEFDPLWEEQN
jgi:hypothetical protein